MNLCLNKFFALHMLKHKVQYVEGHIILYVLLCYSENKKNQLICLKNLPNVQAVILLLI